MNEAIIGGETANGSSGPASGLIAIGPSIEHDEVRARLPHRPPFLFVDRAEDYQPGISLIGIKNVAANEPYFAGHYPESPILPGVLIIEAMAQTSALLVSKTHDIDIGRTIILFMGVQDARFRAPVLPGAQLALHVKFVFQRNGIFKFEGKAMIGETLAAQAVFAAKRAEL